MSPFKKVQKRKHFQHRILQTRLKYLISLTSTYNIIWSLSSSIQIQLYVNLLAKILGEETFEAWVSSSLDYVNTTRCLTFLFKLSIIDYFLPSCWSLFRGGLRLFYFFFRFIITNIRVRLRTTSLSHIFA